MPNRRRALPLTAACILAVPAFGAENAFDGTYTGERVLTVGDPAACVAKDAASATIQGDQLTFTHSAVKDYTISFSPRADGCAAAGPGPRRGASARQLHAQLPAVHPIRPQARRSGGRPERHVSPSREP